MQKMESVQKNTAEKDIHKHVDISLEGSAEEVHLAKIYIANIINHKVATYVKRLSDNIIIVKYVVKVFLLSA